jgi:hypothetical protein
VVNTCWYWKETKIISEVLNWKILIYIYHSHTHSKIHHFLFWYKCHVLASFQHLFTFNLKRTKTMQNWSLIRLLALQNQVTPTLYLMQTMCEFRCLSFGKCRWNFRWTTILIKIFQWRENVFKGPVQKVNKSKVDCGASKHAVFKM